MTASGGASHDVRIWAIARYKGTRRTTYTVRWLVAGSKTQRTFSTAKLAEGFRTELLVAARDGVAFDVGTGLPVTELRNADARTWMSHAVEYAAMKWPTASARHRHGIAEALTAVTLALADHEATTPAIVELRRALMRWAFAGPARDEQPPDELAEAVAWLERHSPPMTVLNQPAILRSAVDALGATLDGKLAAAATFARKRATFNNALEYAVDLELLEANPLSRLRLRQVNRSEVVNRRVVVNPQQARRLLDAVWADNPPLAAFFGCLYFAALRPAEARYLRSTDCRIPEEGWGELVLSGSHQEAGTAWTDTGARSEERTLKHRGAGQVRRVPAHPELVALLRRHMERFEPGVGGRLFVSRTGRAGVPLAPPYQNPVSMNTVYRAWARARDSAFAPDQVSSPLARRPYDLRHACLSTWLNAGVSPAQVAEWAGHSVQVLLRVYAGCVDGEAEVAMRRIEAALRG